MTVVSMNYLLEAGVHFGHQTKRWNPKMKEYIFNSRDDIYIIDLEKTKACLEKAYEEVKTIASNGGKFLFVGTRKQAGEVCLEEAKRSNSYYVTERWLGGTLTNFRTIRRRVKRLEEIEKMEADGTFELLPKKEVIGLRKEYEKLNKLLSDKTGQTIETIEKDTERDYYQAKRKESNERLINKKGLIGRVIGFAPMVCLFVGYLIIPLVFVGMTSMSGTFSALTAK